MKSLRRCEAAGFTLSDAVTITELEAMTEKEREMRILPVELVFSHLKKITLQPFFSRLARSGVEIYLKKLGIELDLGERVTLFDEKGFFALGEVRKFEEGAAIKPIKQFDV